MACEEIEVSRDKDKGGALFFKAKFKRFVTVTNTRQRVRVKVDMPAGSNEKVKVGTGVIIDDRVVWNHGNPPGAPLRPGDLSSMVNVHYGVAPQLTSKERKAFGRDIIGHPQVRYFDSATAEEITGARRNALIQDLVRDARAARAAEARSKGAPAGVDLKKFGPTGPNGVFGENGPLRGPFGPFGPNGPHPFTPLGGT
jgi:hypothetical protein